MADQWYPLTKSWGIRCINWIHIVNLIGGDIHFSGRSSGRGSFIIHLCLESSPILLSRLLILLLSLLGMTMAFRDHMTILLTIVTVIFLFTVMGNMPITPAFKTLSFWRKKGCFCRYASNKVLGFFRDSMLWLDPSLFSENLLNRNIQTGRYLEFVRADWTDSFWMKVHKKLASVRFFKDLDNIRFGLFPNCSYQESIVIFLYRPVPLPLFGQFNI